MSRILDEISSKQYIPPLLGKNFRSTVRRLLRNVFPSLEFTIFTAGIIKKLSTPNFYTKSQVFLPFLSKTLLPPKVRQFSEASTSPPF